MGLADRAHVAALAGYIVVTVALTHPIAFRMASSLTDTGDPLFNSWVLAWNARSLLSGDLRGLLDTNIFFPTPNTAAYSEFLVTQSLVAAPVRLVTENPIIAYNVALLVAIVSSAFGAYLLASHLSSRPAGFIAGLIFAFNPFMVNHLSHLQVVSAGGLPLALLYLHKFFDRGRTRHLLAFSGFYVLQALANTSYALYLTLVAGLLIVVHVIQRRRFLDWPFWGHIALHAGIAIALLGPFFYHYVMLRRDFELMVRQSQNVASAFSFLATPPINRLYGAATAPFFTNEAALFPGLCAAAFAVLGFRGSVQRDHRPSRPTAPRWAVIAYRTVNWSLVLVAAILIEIVGSGGIDTAVGPIPIRATSAPTPIAVGVILAVARVWLGRRFEVASRADASEPRRHYAVMLALAVGLALPTGLSALVHTYVPGFDGMRGVPRIHVISMLAVAVLASYGVAAVAHRFRGGFGHLVTGVVALVIAVEYVSVPIPVVPVPLRPDMPALYRWLATEDDDFALVEYPIVREHQRWQLYFSTYHWKRLVTGASAFPSWTYVALLQRNEPIPSPTTLDDFEGIGVRYLVVHDGREPDDDPGQLDAALDRISDRIRLVETFESYDVTDLAGPAQSVIARGRARVYELTRSAWQSPQQVRNLPGDTPASTIDRAGWTATASPESGAARFAIDGSLSTRWRSHRHLAGDFLQVDLGRETSLGGVVLEIIDTRGHEAPRGYRLDVSPDGQTWSTVAERSPYQLPLTEFLRPGGLRKVDIPFETVAARHVRVVQTGRDFEYGWSVNEIRMVTTP